MKKELFKDYLQNSMEEVEVDVQLKRDIAKQLFINKPEKRHFWTWTKAIFTAPVVATIAIILFLNFNKEVVQNVLLPPDALAQAINNTFNFDSFETTFGLPNDGRFYHRKMTYVNNYPQKYTYFYNEPSKTTIDLWSDGKVVRKDTVSFFGVEKKRGYNSYLINSTLDLSCGLSVFFTCDSISKANNSEGELKGFMAGEGEPKKVEEENLISDLSLEPYFEDSADPGYILQWSTSQPMKYVHIISGQRYVSFDDHKENYTNIFKNGKYWHRVYIAKDWDDFTNPDPNTQYFQITDKDPYSAPEEERLKMLKNPSITKRSMIYIIDAKNNVSPVSPDAFIKKIEKRNTIGSAFQEIIDKPLRVAIFSLNQGEIKDPIFSKNIEKKGKDVIQLRYKLPKAYFTTMGIDLGEREKLFLDLFLTEDASRFLGYEFVRNDQVFDSLWIEDEILDDNRKDELFDQEKWRAGLTEEEKAKAQEQKEWNEWMQQGPGG